MTLFLLFLLRFWAEFMSSFQVIKQTDSSYNAGQCAWVVDIVEDIKSNITVIINVLTVREYNGVFEITYWLAVM
jgi:hypothetical protein